MYIYIYVCMYVYIYIYTIASFTTQKVVGCFGGVQTEVLYQTSIQILFGILDRWITIQNTTTTCVPSFFCPRSGETSKVVVRRSLGLYFQRKKCSKSNDNPKGNKVRKNIGKAFL